MAIVIYKCKDSSLKIVSWTCSQIKGMADRKRFIGSRPLTSAACLQLEAKRSKFFDTIMTLELAIMSGCPDLAIFYVKDTDNT